MIDWFGIRGIGSVFYLLCQGVDGRIADTLVSLTLWIEGASIVAHGLSAQPLECTGTSFGAAREGQSAHAALRP